MPVESKKFGDGQSTDNSNSKRGCSFKTYDNGCGWTNRTYISSRSSILFVHCGFMYEMASSISTEIFDSESSVRGVKEVIHGRWCTFCHYKRSRDQFYIKFNKGILEDVWNNAKIQHTRTFRIIQNRGKMESNI